MKALLKALKAIGVFLGLRKKPMGRVYKLTIYRKQKGSK